ncbi:MAG: hypothetical protein AB7K52_04225 [Phycisphaerales bacterium]
MGLILVGIDEAGYGPLLGPLCIGMSAVRIEDWKPGDPAPDLWKRLSGSVCRKGNDARGRVAVEDSKRLKLANDSTSRHPLTHLDRGVHAFLRALGRRPTTDLELLECLGSVPEPHAWYAGPALDAPASGTPEQMDIAGNVLVRGLADAGVTVLELACCVVGEGAFNAAVRAHRTKAAASAVGLGAHFRDAWERWGPDGLGPDGGARIVCDRQGGRVDYEATLVGLVPGAEVRVVEQRPERGRYELSGDGRAMSVIFQPEAESAYLPVALASMAAKLVRETLMARFNRHWCALLPELKPTAGYTQDGRRWLREARAVLSAQDKDAMIRIA